MMKKERKKKYLFRTKRPEVDVNNKAFVVTIVNKGVFKIGVSVLGRQI